MQQLFIHIMILMKKIFLSNYEIFKNKILQSLNKEDGKNEIFFMIECV